MPSSRFTISSNRYLESSGDYVAIPWLDANTPMFEPGLTPRKYSSLGCKKKGETRLVSLTSKDGKAVAVSATRLDGPDGDHSRQVKRMVANAIGEAQKLGLKRVVVFGDPKFQDLLLAVQEGALLGGYVFDKYLSRRKRAPTVRLVTSAPRSIFKEGALILGHVNKARDLLNEPPIEINPETLAESFKEVGATSGLKVDVWGPKKLETENCGGILSVGKGSSVKPRLVIGRYGHRDADVHLALVGKGITFDSGGYSLKPGKAMEEMKMDMGGAAMTFLAACAIAQMGLRIKLTVFCPLAHNALSANAYNVSDIVTARNGKTIEVLNTDAEGRIILADALSLACEEKPDYLLDSATLTGSAVMALGEDIAAFYGTDEDFNSALTDAADVAGENLWEMPLHAPYDEQLDSHIADVKNIGGKWGGSITAALFLKRFIKGVDRWIHLDIAGPGCKTESIEHLGKGAKGFGVKTVVELARALES